MNVFQIGKNKGKKQVTTDLDAIQVSEEHTWIDTILFTFWSLVTQNVPIYVWMVIIFCLF